MLKSLTVSPGDADSDIHQITLQADGHTWLFTAHSSVEKRMWLASLRRALHALHAHQGKKGVAQEEEEEERSVQQAWVLDAPEDIEVFIAQRAWHDAIDLVERAEDELRG